MIAALSQQPSESTLLWDTQHIMLRVDYPSIPQPSVCQFVLISLSSLVRDLKVTEIHPPPLSLNEWPFFPGVAVLALFVSFFLTPVGTWKANLSVRIRWFVHLIETDGVFGSHATIIFPGENENNLPCVMPYLCVSFVFHRFPLYSRGERFHFEYGVYLLNKNIAQVTDKSIKRIHKCTFFGKHL